MELLRLVGNDRLVVAMGRRAGEGGSAEQLGDEYMVVRVQGLRWRRK